MSNETIHDELQQPDIGARHILLLAGGCLAFLFVSIAVLALIYHRSLPSQRPFPPQFFPEPRLRTDEVQELHRLRARQQQELEGYRWVDRDKALVSIPIERAMALIAQRGTDAYGPLDQAPSRNSP